MVRTQPGDTTSLRPRTGSQAIERAISVLYALEGTDQFIPISELAASTTRKIDVEAAAPHLHSLSSQIRITASLGVAEDDQAVTVYSARPPVSFCDHQIPQQRAALDTTAMGRAIVAFAGKRSRRESQTPALDTARRRGYALSDPADVTAIAVPVFDAGGRVKASVSVQALSVRLNPTLISQIYPAMRSTAAMLSDSATQAPRRIDPAELLRGTI